MTHLAWGMSLVLLSGCAFFESPGQTAQVPVAGPAFPDPACRVIAEQKTADSVANGYDTRMQAIVAQGAYSSCMALK